MTVVAFAILTVAVMSPLLSILILAALQGLTEFLPVSSSGHLALGQILMGVGQGSLVEDIVLHLGTLCAVLVFYRADILELARGLFARGPAWSSSRRYVAYLVLGNIPIGVVGVLAEDRVKSAFDHTDWILAALALTGATLFATRFVRRGGSEVDLRRAMIIGMAQSIAILPGCSRSGWTIAAALALGVSPSAAARFSFLLSIPAILGAAALELPDLDSSGTSATALLLGALVSAAVGFLCLSWLVRLVRNMELHRFAYYLWILAIVGAIWL
jgi:undecaprenyl-diphosphatase